MALVDPWQETLGVRGLRSSSSWNWKLRSEQWIVLWNSSRPTAHWQISTSNAMKNAVNKERWLLTTTWLVKGTPTSKPPWLGAKASHESPIPVDGGEVPNAGAAALGSKVTGPPPPLPPPPPRLCPRRHSRRNLPVKYRELVTPT